MIEPKNKIERVMLSWAAVHYFYNKYAVEKGIQSEISLDTVLSGLKKFPRYKSFISRKQSHVRFKILLERRKVARWRRAKKKFQLVQQKCVPFMLPAKLFTEIKELRFDSKNMPSVLKKKKYLKEGESEWKSIRAKPWK